MPYILQDGRLTTADEIRTAVQNKKAVIVYGRGEGSTVVSLMLNSKHFDTRGQCESMWNEAWTREPETVQQALRAAYFEG